MCIKFTPLIHSLIDIFACGLQFEISNITRLQQASDISRQLLKSGAFTRVLWKTQEMVILVATWRHLGHPPWKSLLFFLLFSLKWSHTLCFQICSCPPLRQLLYLLSSIFFLPGHFLVTIKLCLFFSSLFPPGPLPFLPSSEKKDLPKNPLSLCSGWVF